MSGLTREIRQLRRMLSYKKSLNTTSYLELEINALESSIEALELIIELGWAHVIKARLTRKEDDETTVSINKESIYD